ncbi:MAG: xanthine dehydrogenase family protein subunit M, partial [Candidatus Binatia bacterium]
MKPAAFEYHRPRTIDDALALLSEVGEDGKILAGGQSLVPLMNFRLAQPAHVIDINFIGGLDDVRSEYGQVKIGCLARQSQALEDPLIRERCPLLTDALAQVGYSQTRNRGTVCGSLAHADPAAELPAVLLALDGVVTVGNAKRRRSIAAQDLYLSYLTTALANDEMILEASFPEMAPGTGWSFTEFARRFGDFAIVGVAALLVPAKDRIADARIALIGVGDKPWRQRRVEEQLLGKKASTDIFAKVSAEIAGNISPVTDIHASESYRRSLAKVLTRRALAEAWERAR